MTHVGEKRVSRTSAMLPSTGAGPHRPPEFLKTSYMHIHIMKNIKFCTVIKLQVRKNFHNRPWTWQEICLW